MKKFIERIKNPDSGKRMVVLGIVYILIFGGILVSSLVWQFSK